MAQQEDPAVSAQTGRGWNPGRSFVGIASQAVIELLHHDKIP